MFSGNYVNNRGMARCPSSQLVIASTGWSLDEGVCKITKSNEVAVLQFARICPSNPTSLKVVMPDSTSETQVLRAVDRTVVVSQAYVANLTATSPLISAAFDKNQPIYLSGNMMCA
jgi:hypothetical protein